MPESVNELKVKAYDLGKQLGELQAKANIIVEKIKTVNSQIAKQENGK